LADLKSALKTELADILHKADIEEYMTKQDS